MNERTHKKSNWSSTVPQQDSALKLRRFTTKDDKDEEIQQSPDINLSKFSLSTNSPFPDGNIQRQEEGEKEEGEETPRAQLKTDTPTAEEPEEEIQTKLTVGQPGDKYEQEADTFSLKGSFPIQTSASETAIMLEPLLQNPGHHILEEPRLGNSLRKPTSLLPPLTLKNSSVDLNLPPQFQMELLEQELLEQKSKLPQWFWHSLPKKSPSDPFITTLSRWLTKKLGRRDIAMIAAQIGAELFYIDKKKTTRMLEKAMISAGEKGLKKLLFLVLKEIVGSPNKQQKPESGFIQREVFPESKFFINSPAFKF
ncbi:MAG: hypothetical protein KI793_05470 [Rivularia sp. (in: Bacteria)]|nr:hypothetical protein [Rivularia sp. MS3]